MPLVTKLLRRAASKLLEKPTVRNIQILKVFSKSSINKTTRATSIMNNKLLWMENGSIPPVVVVAGKDLYGICTRFTSHIFVHEYHPNHMLHPHTWYTLLQRQRVSMRSVMWQEHDRPTTIDNALPTHWLL